ncbi:trace amine-associated receptor 8a-like [Boleophthalmus pectinirostris]|uniref:trace amine-associated receptor 8a-like n=1 Tax=Boleophthalmus pectinirostris TaxID=150288 RepID=UPI000A1C2D50|nr:trace amine-associated receptor 8a-like [Boleophthalmus pectinirostris]
METPNEADLCFPTINNSCRRTPHPELESTVIYILLSTITVLTVILNLLVIISITHFRQLHTCTNFLLLSLAVADFLVGSLQMPFQIFYYEGCWLLGDILCIVYFFSGYLSVGVSCGNMILISADRYIAICDPLLYHSKVTTRRVQVCICLCWISVIVHVSWIMRDFVKQPGSFNSCVGECVLVLVHPEEGIADIFISLVVPLTIITVLYLRVFIVAVSQARAMRSQISSVALNPSGTMAKKLELKAAKALGVLVIVFIICCSPYYAFALSAENNQVDPSSGDVEVWLIYFNSCINPIIYAFSYPWFRKSIKHIVTLQILEPDSRDSRVL